VGWRFHKRLSLGRFARVNFSKSGVSLGLGPRGFNVNIGPKGMRTTAGIPGTGLSYQTFSSWREQQSPAASAPAVLPLAASTPASTGSSGFPYRLSISLACAFVLVLGWQNVQSTRSPSTTSANSGPPPAAASPIAPTPTAQASKPVLTDADNIRELQRRLKELRHDPGAIDGIDGPATRKAIRSYLSSQGLSETDEPTAPLLMRLRAANSTAR
jgi:hypothetical protein